MKTNVLWNISTNAYTKWGYSNLKWYFYSPERFAKESPMEKHFTCTDGGERGKVVPKIMNGPIKMNQAVMAELHIFNVGLAARECFKRINYKLNFWTAKRENMTVDEGEGVWNCYFRKLSHQWQYYQYEHNLK